MVWARTWDTVSVVRCVGEGTSFSIAWHELFKKIKEEDKIMFKKWWLIIVMVINHTKKKWIYLPGLQFSPRINYQ